MDMNTAFPSEFLRAADLQGREFTVPIDRVEMVSVVRDEPDKPVLYFQGAEKGLVMNKTNATTLIDRFGPESNDWTGQRVTVFPTETDYQGKRVACVRLRIPLERPKVELAPEEPAELPGTPRRPTAAMADDDTPF